MSDDGRRGTLPKEKDESNADWECRSCGGGSYHPIMQKVIDSVGGGGQAGPWLSSHKETACYECNGCSARFGDPKKYQAPAKGFARP